MRVALVYDRVNKWGGAERVLLALHKIFPQAPLFTAVYDRKRASWARVFNVHPSFLQRIPFAHYIHESLPIVTPMAFESFSFDEYDIVISVTSAEAKDIITKPETLHICYCLTPTRYLWSGYEQYQKNPGLGIFSAIASGVLRAFAPTLRNWDLIASHRADYYIAISERVKKRIETYYKREVAAVIHPPVDLTKFAVQQDYVPKALDQPYYLTVSRLVSYKRLDIVIEAFNELGLPLVIVGDGRHKRVLQRMARTNIRFIDHHLTDSDLVRYYEGCRAFVFAGDEDFGLSALEAQAMGKPVIAYKESGIAEIVKDNDTGILFSEQTRESLTQAVIQCQTRKFSSTTARKQAEKFGEAKFCARMEKTVRQILETHRKHGHK